MLLLLWMLCLESMVEMQSTPDSAVSPTYSALHAFQTGRYDVDVPSISLDPFYYAAGPPGAPSLVAGGLGGPSQPAGGGGLDGYPVAAAARLQHGASKRLKYPAAVDEVAGITFARTENHHHHLPCQQSTQAWNSGVASHGTEI